MAERLSLPHTLALAGRCNASPSAMVSISAHTHSHNHVRWENHHQDREAGGCQQNPDWQRDLADASAGEEETSRPKSVELRLFTDLVDLWFSCSWVRSITAGDKRKETEAQRQRGRKRGKDTFFLAFFLAFFQKRGQSVFIFFEFYELHCSTPVAVSARWMGLSRWKG